MLGSPPPEIMQALVEHYSTKGWLQHVEQCVLHMDISFLDFNQGPKIRTGFLKDGKPPQLKQGQEVTISIDYTIKGDEKMVCKSYKKLAYDVKHQRVILCTDGTVSSTVYSCDTMFCSFISNIAQVYITLWQFV